MKIELKEEKKEKEETVLDENAVIYSKRDKKSEKEKFKELRGKEKWKYFKDYYLRTVIVVTLVAAFLVSVIYSMVRERPEVVLTVTVLDNPLRQEVLDDMTTTMESLLVSDPEKQEIFIDTSYYMSGENAYYGSMKLMTLIAAREVDAMIMPMSEFQSQVNGGTLATLETFFTAEELEQWKDYIITVTPSETDIATDEVTYGEPGQYGFKINSYLEAHGYDLTDITVTYVVGFVVNTEHPDSCREFAHYLFD